MMEEKLWTSGFLKSAIVMFGIYLSSSVLMSVMAVFAKSISGQDTYAGLMTSLFTFGALSVRFVAGKLVDRLNTRTIILSGMVLLMVGSILFLKCVNIQLAILARAIQGIGFGFAATASGTKIALSCPPSRLLEGISYTSMMISVSSVIGPSIGFIIIGNNHDRFSLLFLTTLILSATLFTLTLLDPYRSVSLKETPSHHSNGNDVPKIVGGIPPLILFFNSLTQSAVVSFLAIYAISRSFEGIGAFFSINAAGMFISRFFMSKVVKAFGSFRTILINTMIFGVCILLITRAQSMTQLYLIALPAGFALGAISPIIHTYLIQNIPGQRKGLASAIFYSTLDIGYGMGSLIWGMVALRFGYLTVFTLAASMQIISLILCYAQIRIEALGFRDQKE